MSRRVVYHNQACRVVYQSYEPCITVRQPHKYWQFAAIELITMAIGFLVVYI